MSDPREVLGPVLAEAVAALIAEGVAAALADRPTEEPWPAYMSVATAARYFDVTEERVRGIPRRRARLRVQEVPGCRVFVARTDADALMASWRVEARS